MLIKRFLILVVLLLAGGTAYAADVSELQITSSTPGAVVSLDRVIRDDKVVVSVLDADGDPVFGLQEADFAVTEAGRTAEILSATPLAENLDVPRNFVLVLDNSYSMKERRAINALLGGVDRLLKIVRPIDKVYLVVFRNFGRTDVGEYQLAVDTFESNDPDELRKFLGKAYSKGITGKTVLYDAILAGLTVIKEIPEEEPRLMVVFSDGADLNSEYDREYVLNESKSVKGYSAYAIDYTPEYNINSFLAEFSDTNSGRVWKARTENNLVDIFQEVASKMEYYYVVSYRFPPTGSLAVDRSVLKFDEIRVAGREPETFLDDKGLTLRPSVDSVYGIAEWKATVANGAGTVAELSGKGAPGPELKVGLPAGDPQALAAGGELSVRMDLLDNRGQKLALNAPNVRVEVSRTSASLTAVPDTLKFDEIRVAGKGPEILLDAPVLTLRPAVDSVYGIVRWKATVGNDSGEVASISGQGNPAGELTVGLPTGNLSALAAGGDLTVRMEMADNKGHNIAVEAQPVKVEFARTLASLFVAPAGLTVEEIKTVDYSPILNHVYFDKGSSVIPERYVRLTDPGEMAAFDERSFRGSLEKYYQILNIFGKRLKDNPETTVTIVGCNDNDGEEKGNKKLSAARAEVVRDYLQMAWDIAPERMTVESRNLPEMPSASRLEEGRAENRRVEIRSDDRAINMAIQSNYFTYRIDSPSISIQPIVSTPYGIENWKVAVSNGLGSIMESSGTVLPEDGIEVPTAGWDLETLSDGGDIQAVMELRDSNGREIEVSADPVKVSMVRSSQMLAKKEGVLVQEKYALILFDFNKAAIGPQNQYIIDSIAARASTLPEATIEIVGHSDNIGKEDYNIKLSEKRALSAYDLLKAVFEGDQGERIRHLGVGPNNPLYDNLSPEARSFNRTVTITLEYMSDE